ncbi:MAG: HAD-IIIA family hydrolase [Planctomycetota bacterium]
MNDPNSPAPVPAAFRGSTPRALILDVDGVLTDNSIVLDAEGRESKRFHVPDGGGLKWVAQCGVKIGWLSGRRSSAVEARAAELGIETVETGVSRKRPTLDQMIAEFEVDANDVVYVGDDFIDLSAFAGVGLPVAVANAHPLVREAACAVTTRCGGDGAVREVCEWILHARNEFHQIMARFEA